MARPHLPKQEKREHRVPVYFTEEEVRALQREARAEHLQLATHIRRKLFLQAMLLASMEDSEAAA